MNIGDLVRLTPDGVVAAWYPGVRVDAVGVVIGTRRLAETYQEALPDHLAYPAGTVFAEVEWPDGRDTHMLQDLDIVRKHFS